MATLMQLMGRVLAGEPVACWDWDRLLAEAPLTFGAEVAAAALAESRYERHNAFGPTVGRAASRVGGGGQ